MLLVMHLDSYLGDFLCTKFIYDNSLIFDSFTKTDAASKTSAGPSYQIYDVNCPAIDTTSANPKTVPSTLTNMADIGDECTSQIDGFRFYVPLELASQNIKITTSGSASLSYSPSAICFYDKSLTSA